MSINPFLLSHVGMETFFLYIESGGQINRLSLFSGRTLGINYCSFLVSYFN